MKPNNLKKRITVSVVAQTASQLFIGVIGVVIMKIMTSSLGVEGYGIYATALAFVNTFSLFASLGITTITVREISRQPDKATEIISHNIGLRLALCAVVVPLISIIGLLVYPRATNNLHLAILLMSLYLFFDAIWSISTAYFASKVRNDIGAIITSVYQVIFLLGVISVALAGFGLFGFVTVYLLSIAFGAAIAFQLVRKHLPIRPRGNLKIWREIFGMSIAFGMITVIDQLYFKADSIMLSVFAGTTAAGVYGVAYALVSVFWFIPSYLMGSLIPSIAATDSREALERIVRKSFHLLASIGMFLPVVSYYLSKDVVLIVSNHNFIAAAVPFSILMVGTMFFYMTSTFKGASVALDKHHKLLYVSVAMLLLNIGLNIVAIPKYGLSGAAYATLTSEIISFVIIYLLFRKQTGISVGFSVLIKPAIAAAVTFGISAIIHDVWSLWSPFINTAIGGSAMALVYILVLFATGGMPEDIQNVLVKLINHGKVWIKRLIQHRATTKK